MNTNDSLEVKNNRAKKMMLWFGMISMSMTFAGLTSAYVVSSSRSDWIQQIELPFAFTLSTLLIIFSSGSFYGALKMIQSQKVDAIIAIGNVIQGETKHFDFVCEGVTQGIVDLNIKFDIPVIFCVLTDNTKQQSIDRSGGKLGNKGTECAVAAIKMAAIKNLNRTSENIGF